MIGPVSREGRILAAAGLVVVIVAVGLSLRSARENDLAPEQSTTQAATQATAQTGVHGSVSPRDDNRSWREVEKGVGYLHRKDVPWFLKRTRVPDFEAELGRAVELATLADWIEGCHEGHVRLDDGREWVMKTEISSERGTTDVVLSEKGSVFVNSIGSGGLRDLRTLGKGSTAVILEASEDIFFQLYPLREDGALVGNLYQRAGDGKLGFGGTVVLEKKACANG